LSKLAQISRFFRKYREHYYYEEQSQQEITGF